MTVTNAARSDEYTDPTAVAFIIAADHRPAPFRLDDTAFDRWFAGRDQADTDDWLPDWIECGAGARMAQLVLDAWRSGVLGGDPDVELTVCGDDDGETSGFYVILNNRSGAQTALGLTSGWQELLHLDELSPQQRVRAHLEEVCAIANFTLAQLHVRRPGR